VLFALPSAYKKVPIQPLRCSVLLADEERKAGK